MVLLTSLSMHDAKVFYTHLMKPHNISMWKAGIHLELTVKIV